MSATSGALSALKDHLMTALATSALLGAGSMVVGLKVNDARQDQQLKAASELLPIIQKDVKETHDAVVRLEAQKEK